MLYTDDVAGPAAGGDSKSSCMSCLPKHDISYSYISGRG